MDGAHWGNFLTLFRIPEGARPVRREGLLLVFVSGRKVLRAVRAGYGPIPAQDIDWHGRGTPLAPIRKRHHASRVVVFEEDALPRLFGGAESLLGHDQDLVQQVMNILRAARLQLGDGIWVDPPVWFLGLLPTYEVIQRTFDRVLPDGRSFVLYVMDEATGKPWSSLILSKSRGDVTLLTSHLAIADEVTLGRTWRRDYKHVLTAVRDRIAPPHAAIFLSLEAARRVFHGPWGSLVREMARRHAVVDPAPAVLLGILGGTMALGALGWLDRLRGGA